MTDKFEIELVKSAKRGDIDSFAKLCQSYYSSMVAIAYSILLDHHLAEDAAQEAFAKALRNLNSLKQESKFPAWLSRICRNSAKDILKAKPRQINTEDFPQQQSDRNDEYDCQIVKQAIGKLPIRERQLIVMRYYNDMSYKQISDVLGITGAAINGRLKRAKKKIAKYLERNGFAKVKL